MAGEHAIADRMQGKFPISISTSLAIESALNMSDEVKHKNVPLLEVKEFWINIRTLFRNLMGSISRDDSLLVTAGAIAQALLQEIEQIESIVGEHTHNRVKVIFYVSNYSGLERKYPKAQLRRDNTEKQKIYTAIQKQTIQGLLDMLKTKGGHDVKVFELGIKSPHAQKAMMLTHYAYDLLSSSEFLELQLLESHTGHIKPKSQWNTKYLDGKQLPMIPFREDLLQIFGDKELFHPYDIRLRREIIEIAKEYRWTVTTTSDKIRYNLSLMKNHFAKDLLKSIIG